MRGVPASADEHPDRWLDLVERFVARGADVKIGNMQPDMIRHLLDVLEEQAVQIDALKAQNKRQSERLDALERPPE